MEEITIKITDVTKTYNLYKKPIDRMKESLSLSGKTFHQKYHAIDRVSINIKKGESVGIVGKNGSGKSTLLKMITGIVTPTSGEIEVHGKISALLELGGGFNADLSGFENIYLNGTILGYSKNYIDQSIAKIIDFADIGDFINQPVKTYSSGMFVRLAFAIAININPEILIVDEALSVGDMKFQQKCYRKIREIKKNGTILFVSHDVGALANFCDRIIWLQDGKIYKEGKPDQILDEYQAYMRYDIIEMKEVQIGEDKENYSGNSKERTSVKYFGNNDAQFTRITLFNKSRNKNTTFIRGGEIVIIKMVIQVNNNISMPILGFNLKDSYGIPVIVTNNFFENITINDFEKNKEYTFSWEFTFPFLRNGKYSFDIALASGTYYAHEQIQWINDALIIDVDDDRPYQNGRGYLVPKDITIY